MRKLSSVFYLFFNKDFFCHLSSASAISRWHFLGRIFPDFLYLNRVEIVITSRCSLHCRHCSNLMQYYSAPQIFPVKELLDDIRCFLAVVDRINVFNILGGEPFLHPDLPEILDMLLTSRQIRRVELVTNATILPSEALLSRLKNSKCLLRISNYLPYSHKLNALLDLCREHEIRYELQSMQWHDPQHSNFKNKSEKQLREDLIRCNGGCHELYRGEFHLCPTSSNGMALGLVPRDEHFYVQTRHDFTKQSIRERKRKMKKLLHIPYINACQYCDAASSGPSRLVPAGEQLPQGTYLSVKDHCIHSRNEQQQHVFQ